jgi:hypothetical protein
LAANGSIQSTDKRGHKSQGPAELTLKENGDAITGTFVFTSPRAARVAMQGTVWKRLAIHLGLRTV